MKAQLVGIQLVNFTNNKGETIIGTNIFCAFKDENVEGLRTEKFFLKSEVKLPDCKINDTIEISFNMIILATSGQRSRIMRTRFL